ncbi:hypothetical protein PU560_09030, partial [Georgenia sp. 10Sc9-8]|nr:hypothetical protein [Georgenia halotolerans]
RHPAVGSMPVTRGPVRGHSRAARRSAWQSRRTAVVAGAAVLLSSCSTTPENADGLATYEPRGSGGMDALMVGTLVLEDGCLYVRSADFDERWLPVFPADGVRWDGRTLTFGGGNPGVGDQVELPGGAVTEPTSPHPVPEEYDVPAACSTELVWLVTPA